MLATNAAFGALAVDSGATLNASQGNSPDTWRTLAKPGPRASPHLWICPASVRVGIFLTIGDSLTATVANSTMEHNGFNAAEGNGTIAVGDVTIAGPMFRLALPDLPLGAPTSGSITFGQLNSAAGWQAGSTVVMLWIGNGSVRGDPSGQQLALITTSGSATASLNGAVANSSGSPFNQGPPARPRPAPGSMTRERVTTPTIPA